MIGVLLLFSCNVTSNSVWLLVISVMHIMILGTCRVFYIMALHMSRGESAFIGLLISYKNFNCALRNAVTGSRETQRIDCLGG